MTAPDNAVFQAISRAYKAEVSSMEHDNNRLRELKSQIICIETNLGDASERRLQLDQFAATMGWDTKELLA